jgi:hypothetical protein
MASLISMYIWDASWRYTARHGAAYPATVVSDSDKALEALRWHWGEAYVIAHPGPDVWLAERRDDHATLRAGTPAGLRDLIVKDYMGRPVSRDLH